MKKWMISFLLAAVMLTGCAAEESSASDEEPMVKPQTATTEEVSTEDVAAEDAVTEDAATDESSESSTSDTVSQLVAELRENEAVNRENKEVISIDEKVFLSQMTDIYMNTNDYIGRIISMEGYMLPDDTGDDIIGAVVRNSPGCCGDDGITGLSFIWGQDVPAENDWIKVTGVLSVRVEGEQIYLVIEADDVEVKEERGLEFVSQ
ncbi:MAG: TIGR03943 family putative permease subunit [Lachnospiraceae bacterium]